MRPIVLALAVLCLFVVLSGGVGPAAPGTHSAVLHIEGVPSELNTTVTCGLFGPHPGTAPNPDPQYTARIAAIWEKVCVNSTFVVLMSTWGDLYTAWTETSDNYSYLTSANLTAGSYGNSNDPVVPYWDLTWWALCGNTSVAPAGADCEHSAVWTGNVTTESFTGPNQSASISDVCACGEQPALNWAEVGPFSGLPLVALGGALVLGAVVGVRAEWVRRRR